LPIVGDIGRFEMHRPCGCLGKCLQARRVGGQVGGHHRVAGFGQCAADRRSQATDAAGDQCDAWSHSVFP